MAVTNSPGLEDGNSVKAKIGPGEEGTSKETAGVAVVPPAVNKAIERERPTTEAEEDEDDGGTSSEEQAEPNKPTTENTDKGKTNSVDPEVDDKKEQAAAETAARDQRCDRRGGEEKAVVNETTKDKGLNNPAKPGTMMVHFSPVGKNAVARCLGDEMDNSTDKGKRNGEEKEEIGTATQRAEETPLPEEVENDGTEEDKEGQLETEKQKENSKPGDGAEAGIQEASGQGAETTMET
jgi:hypothetical protein